jgi:hypothetical protein
VKKEEPPPPPKKKEDPPPPPKTAKDVIVPGTTFMLSVDDSADAKKAVTDPCAKKKKDEDKKKCSDEATALLAKEGIRFEKDEKGGGWLYVAFAKDAKDKEIDLNKIPVKDPKEEGPNKYTFTLHGKDAGKKAIKFKEGDKWSVDLVDENTVAVTDAKRGKLVYKKKLVRRSLAAPSRGPGDPGPLLPDRGASRPPGFVLSAPGQPRRARSSSQVSWSARRASVIAPLMFQKPWVRPG